MCKKTISFSAVAVLGFSLMAFYVTSPKGILQNSQRFTLYSLNPTLLRPDPNANDMRGKGVFHGYPVLGKTQITDSKLKATLVNNLYRAINEGEKDGLAAGCFNPRHGIHAAWLGQSVDVVICFECAQVNFYKGGSANHLLISGDAQDEFDLALSSAGIPLSGKPELKH